MGDISTVFDVGVKKGDTAEVSVVSTVDMIVEL